MGDFVRHTDSHNRENYDISGLLNMSAVLKSPFPYFGGKSTVARQVWQAFGTVENYVEPFFGSGAVLLGRLDFKPDHPPNEVVNDKDGFISNFWRALQHDPKSVAQWANYPVIENDLYARHCWLVEQKQWLSKNLEDPEYYDPKIAGWWVWGISCWIGGGWCAGSVQNKMPGLGNRSIKGVHKKRPHLKGSQGIFAVKKQRPHITNCGMGVHKKTLSGGLISEYFEQLAIRMRRVKVLCGDWARLTGRSVTYINGLTGVFLDPPYSNLANRDSKIYTEDDLNVAHKVREWAIQEGNNPLMRIVLCGYEEEHDMPDNWVKLRWKAQGGYAGQGKTPNNQGKINKSKECLWLSPHCNKQIDLFGH